MDLDKKFGILQDKKYIVVLDLELTSWEDKESFEPDDMEIIQIGYVWCESKAPYNIIKEYSKHVKPIYHPELSNFIINLTGIQQKDIDASKNLVVETSILLDNKFLPDPKEFIFASWGNDPIWLNKELNKKTYKKKNSIQFDPRFINIKFHDGKRRGLKKALGSYNIKFEGQQHDALVDAKATYELLKIMNLEPMDCLVSNKRTARQKELAWKKSLSEKLAKRESVSEDLALDVLHNCNYDFQSAKNVLKLCREYFK